VEKEAEKRNDWEVEAAAGRKYVQGKWLYVVKWKDWEKQMWEREDMEGSRKSVER
jgi:hypothetical protein